MRRKRRDQAGRDAQRERILQAREAIDAAMAEERKRQDREFADALEQRLRRPPNPPVGGPPSLP